MSKRANVIAERIEQGAEALAAFTEAPLTVQFFIEDHALGHSFHYLAGIRAALKQGGVR